MLSVYKHKRIISLFVFISFLAVVFLGIAVIMHGPDGRMQSNCPLSGAGILLCPQDTVKMVFHHISIYNSFLNVPINLGIASLATLLLFFIGAVLVNFPGLFPFELFYFVGNPYFPQYISCERKTTHWLALHENSPTTT